MKKSMSSSSSRRQLVDPVPAGLVIPDINIWLALAAPEHPHNAVARRWWQQHQGGIAFVRQSQTGLLRLTTTAAAMDGKPLSVDDAWRVYDRFYEDDRVTFIAEPADVEKEFRERAVGPSASPKVWADAWLLAVAEAAGGVLVTFDKALASRGAHCLLSHRG
jgi:toxin-antitoxin system PIN domain toxin